MRETMKFGQYQIEILETGSFGLDGGAMFGVVPKVLWERSYAPADDKNRIPMVSRALLIRFDDKVIVVDTGNGEKGDEKFRKIYNIDTSKYSLENSLRQFGLSLQDVTDVILTHLHFDHCGGATTVIDGDLVPTFPNATYYIQAEQLEWAKNPTEKDRASFLPENFQPLVDAGKLELLYGDTELFRGIYIQTFYGHTKALQAVRIETSEVILFFPSDLCPTAAHIPYPYIMAYDNFPLTTLAEKKAVFPRAYDEGWILIFQHDAFHQAGKLERSPKGDFLLGETVLLTEYHDVGLEHH